ncbi:hypothetical protein [Myxococcus sp. NMCA1]|uniref:hypothetical protein n=1 Tax=Myxococcus sp. NMCA1 TaxID=2996785 RepID=UPI0022856DAC|nr:hypothetical protein [Myxococcus sp. NMCA1]WAM24517.1 hypothetical protein OZ403_28845 [Myxococcus sp. NMCA1]
MPRASPGRCEETINLFARQLHASAQENERSIQKLDAARRELEEELSTIEQQRLAIRDLSTPIIELRERTSSCCPSSG